MTGQELHDKLKASGTGENKLAKIREFLRGSPDADAKDVLVALGNELPVVTNQKAHAFIQEAKAAQAAKDEQAAKPKQK